MRGRNTFLLRAPAGSYARFVLFPLPPGRQNMCNTWTRSRSFYPEGPEKRGVGRHEFVTAPIADLPLLFPRAALARGKTRWRLYTPAPTSWATVNTRVHLPARLH